MAKAQYRHAHQQERKRWIPVVAAGQAYCAEPVCVMRSRLIPPAWAHTQLWHLCHDAASGRTIGPGHRRCNLAERNRRVRNGRPKWRRSKSKPASTTGRWVL